MTFVIDTRLALDLGGDDFGRRLPKEGPKARAAMQQHVLRLVRQHRHNQRREHGRQQRAIRR